MGASSSDYSEWNIDEKWSSQEWKSDEMLEARTVRPDDNKFVIDDDMDSDNVTESNLSLRTRSFLNRVFDRLRKMLDSSPEDSMQDIDKRSMIWWMFMSVFRTSQIQIKYVDTKNQLADMLTKGSFSRDVWNHLTRLLNIASFSLYSCSHVSDFLSDDQVRKQSAMSKRGQKATSNEGSPMAKSEKMPGEDSSQSLGYLVHPGNTDERNEVETALQEACASRLKFRSRIFSSESTRTCCTSIQETGAGGSTPNTQWWEKTLWLQWYKENCCVNTKIEKHGIQYPSIHGKIFQFFAKEIWNVIDESRHPSWANYLANSEIHKNTKFKEIESLFHITQKLVKEHSEEILNVKCL